MGIFGQSSSFDADVEKATSETNTNDNWSFILDVCDEVSTNPKRAKDCLKSIMKRMAHADPHVVMQAITLLDACANNCGKPFHLEIASRDFETEFRRLLGKAQPKVSLKMRQVLKNWAENDFKNDPELNLIPTLYTKLRIEGYDFSNLNDKPVKSSAKASLPKDPNVVSSQQEEDDIAKAIELSLKETKNSPKLQSASASAGGGGSTANAGSTTYPSLYPSFGGGLATSVGSGGGSTSTTTSSGGVSAAGVQQQQQEPRKVRALYDFEAAEENELTFFSSEIIHVLDDSDPNWWKGFNQRGEGLFPSNFVTADLSVDPERLDINQQHKSSSSAKDDERALQQQKTEAAAAAAAAANQPVEIDEAKVDRLLHLLHEANPEDPSEDTNEMLQLEQEVHQMGPLIDAELERVDRKHAQLTQLSSDLVDAINLYHSLMRDDRAAAQFGAGAGATAGFMMGAAGGSIGYPPTAQVFGGYHPGVNYGNSPNGPASLPPQNYGNLHNASLPYVGGTHMPAAAGGYPAGATPPQIPMQYQNGHVGAQLSSLPPHLTNTSMQQQAPPPQQQPTLYGTPTTAAQQQQQHPPAPQQTNYQMLPHEQQQQQPQHAPVPNQTQYPAAAPTTATTAPQSSSSSSMVMPMPQPQYISPQHQQQPQQPPPPQSHMPSYMTPQSQGQIYASGMPNGPQSYMPPQAANMQHQQQTNQPQTNVNNHHTPSIEQFSQLQHQMAAMSIGLQQQQQQQQFAMPPSSAGAPPQTFLMQNDAAALVKNNIPIYQQQR